MFIISREKDQIYAGDVEDDELLDVLTVLTCRNLRLWPLTLERHVPGRV